MNYFTIKQALDMGNGFVMLILSHDYGIGPDVRVPVCGLVSDYQAGNRVEVSVTPLYQGK